MTTFLADGFRDVDGAGDAGKMVRCLSLLDDLPDMRIYKESSIDRLQLRADSRAADVACGLGFDLLRLHRRIPAGTVTGFDASRALVAEARRRVAGQDGVTVREADAHALDAADASFDAVRIDRSLQHMHAPDQVIREMVRVTAPGGLVSASEPDWRTFSLSPDGGPAGTRLVAEWVAGFRNPCVGHDLVDLFADAGLEVCDHTVHTLLSHRFDEADLIFDIRENARRCVQRGIVTDADAQQVLDALQAASAAGGFSAMLGIHTVTGRKG